MPSEDSYWFNVKDFLKTHLKPEEKVLAPATFKQALPNVVTYQATARRSVQQFQWVLVHKGMAEKIHPAFLKQTIESMQPVFANEVFVLFSNRSDLVPITDQAHLQPLLKQAGLLPPTGWKQRLRYVLNGNPGSQLSNLKLNQIFQQTNWVLSRLQSLEQRFERMEQDHQRAQQDIQQAQRELKQQTAPEIRYGIHATSLSEIRFLSRTACQIAYLGDQQILCRILGCYLLFADATDINVAPHLYMNGYWEDWLTFVMLQTLQPGWNCIDVGANHGYYTLLAAGAVGASGRVLALEPNAKLAGLVNQSLTINGFSSYATAMPVAASDKAGETVKLVVPKGNTGGASIYHSINETVDVMEAETVTIDALTVDWERVDFIKIDIEGAELLVWRGMQETIRRNPDIIIVLEFGSCRYADARGFLEEIVAAGFVLRYVCYDGQIEDLSIERCLTERPQSHWDLFLSRK
jgi:FkbM family methyltransferase